MKLRNEKRIEVFFEFLIFGIVIGTIEDVIAVRIVAGSPLTLKMLGTIIMIAIPFAILGELVADRISFIKVYHKIFRKSKKR